ncbi:MAG: hypothetical protein IIA83_10645 [Thaumarchaeota archaeon]|nr:hypothetical protein [Nitrososphaerota archaeon]
MILEKIGKEITFENLDKCFKTFDSGLRVFNKGMDDMLKELSVDVKESNERAEFEAKKNKENLSKLFGSSNSNVKIWSDRKIKLM